MRVISLPDSGSLNEIISFTIYSLRKLLNSFKPAFSSASTKNFEDPSIMGGSSALISIKMLSISKPTKAAKTCSVVFNLTPSFSRVVPLCVLTTYFARASISGLSAKSTLLNIYPVFSFAG